MIRILLADDHQLVRNGIRAILQSNPSFLVVAEANDGHQAIQQAEAHQPDVALLDIAMPGLNGLQALKQLREKAPRTQVVILSMYTNPEYVLKALDAGACGYLLKDSSPETLHRAVRRAARGLRTLGPPLSEAQLSEYRARLGAHNAPLETLSARETEVLQLIAEGNSTRAIANALGISPKTVETHRAHLMEKLDLHDVASLTRFAINVGLISMEQPPPNE